MFRPVLLPFCDRNHPVVFATVAPTIRPHGIAREEILLILYVMNVKNIPLKVNFARKLISELSLIPLRTGPRSKMLRVIR